MKQYHVETHSHTSEISPCSHTPASQYADLFAQHGYDTVFLTNHFCEHVFEVHHVDSWSDRVEFFYNGFDAAKKAVNGRFTLIPAMEICFKTGHNDYLCYGITPEFLLNNPSILEMTPKEFYPIAHQAGITVIQAHPFRFGMKIINPDYLDGYETFNGNPRHNSNNDIAAAWAIRHGKLATQGTDYHEIEDIGLGGMYFDEPVNTTEDFIRLLNAHRDAR